MIDYKEVLEDLDFCKAQLELAIKGYDAAIDAIEALISIELISIEQELSSTDNTEPIDKL